MTEATQSATHLYMNDKTLYLWGSNAIDIRAFSRTKIKSIFEATTPKNSHGTGM